MSDEGVLMQMLQQCSLCPRDCKVDRLSGKKGYCKESSQLVVARAAIHMWEEPCICGEEGSGTVFFSGCSMGCVFCQNNNIAQGKAGKQITVERLSDIFLELQEKRANNINLVTPTHYVPHIIAAICQARSKGLHLPIVYNCSGYEKVETLDLLNGYVDVYLPDFKYKNTTPAKLYSNCEDYYKYAALTIKQMLRQVGEPTFDERGMMIKGVIVRHLAMPGYSEDSKEIIKYLHDTFADSIYLSIMNQYTPMPNVISYPEINRKLTEEEYEEVVNYAIEIGVEYGFIQEGETATDSFIPEFNGEGV